MRCSYKVDPGTTKLPDVFTRVVSVFASRNLLCRSPIIDPHRKARADPLRGRRGYRLAPRYMYRGQAIRFSNFSLFCVTLYYQRVYLHEWYTKHKEWLFSFIINLVKQELYGEFANTEFRYLSRNLTNYCLFCRIHEIALQQSQINPAHILTPF
jgi:hypothetical protein